MEQKTFVGLDVHKNSVVATAVDPWGKRIDQSTFGSSDEELVAYLRSLPGEKHVVLEASTVWEHYFDAAAGTGARVVLSHPLKTRLIAETSLKSDKVDSEALATLLRLDAVPTAYVPDDRTRGLRRTVRDRIFYRETEKRVRNHISGVLLTRGVPFEAGLLGKKGAREGLRKLHVPEIDRGLDVLLNLEAATKRTNTAIHAVFLESPEAQLLKSIPGIGELTAVALAAFLCPIDRFPNFDKLSSYAGLCPTNHQSSTTSFQGALKPDCNHILRWLLVECAWVHRQNAKGSYVSKVGRRIARRKGATRGAVASAHALLRLVFAILKRGTPYSLHAPERPSCKVKSAESP
ncbi:MAG: IS110 family transposase [Thermoplasmata archaeon]|nr:IS110 family transposase [Thermoplasmata archaeon]